MRMQWWCRVNGGGWCDDYDGIGRLGGVSAVRQKWHKSLSIQKLSFAWCKAQHNRVPGEIKIRRWSWTLTLAQKRSWAMPMAMARGHQGDRTLPKHFHCSGGSPQSLWSFSGSVRGWAFTLSSPSPPPPPHPRGVLYKQTHFCGCKAKWSCSIKYHGISYYLWWCCGGTFRLYCFSE